MGFFIRDDFYNQLQNKEGIGIFGQKSFIWVSWLNKINISYPIILNLGTNNVMEKSEWYTNRTWNGAIDGKFEKYLKHTRDTANKAQFMQIQGSLLLENSQQNVQNVGVALLTRVMEDFKTEYTSVILAREKLGDYYLYQHDYLPAQYFYKIVVKYCKEQNSRNGTSTLTDLKLAEALLKGNEADKLLEALDLVIEFPEALLKLMESKYYHSELLAQIYDAMNDEVAAKKFAQAALLLPKLIKPVYKNKTTISPKTSERKLRSLQEIITS